MMSPDESVQFKATLACRKILSAERNPPIDHMIRLGVVPRCVEFLTKNHKLVTIYNRNFLKNKYQPFFLFNLVHHSNLRHVGPLLT